MMKTLRSSLIISIVMFTAFCSIAAPTFAQEYFQPPTPVELDRFRQDLDQMTQEMYRHRDTLARNKEVRKAIESNSKFESAPALAQVRQQIREMNYEELAILYRAFTTQFPDWREAPQVLGTIVNKISGTGSANTSNIADNCQDGINANISNTDISIALGFSIAAHAVAEIVPPVANAPAVAAWVITDVAVLTLETLKAIKDDCTGIDAATVTDIVNTAKNDIINNDNSNVATIVTNDNSNAATLTTALSTATTTITTAVTNAKTEIVNNDNTNRGLIINNDNANTTVLNTAITNAKTQIVNNDNANRVLIVNNSNANTTFLDTAITTAKNEIIANANANKNELVDLMLRTQIEADLAEADNATFVAFYVTPTADGGHLELVRSIVVETITKLAGNQAPQANAFLAAADTDKANGDYKAAYRNYRKAYKKAIN
ncbi:MAG: hypothetical protein WBD22_10590 [Pyrinomonadaceae bacterium]